MSSLHHRGSGVDRRVGMLDVDDTSENLTGVEQQDGVQPAKRSGPTILHNHFFTLSLNLLGIADFKGHFLQVNATWQRVLGFAPEELQGTSCLDLVHPDDLPGMRDRMRPLQQQDVTVSFETRYRCRDGSWRCLNWTAASVLAERLIYISARDITAQKLAEHQVQRLNVALTNRAADLELANAELQREVAVRKHVETALKESNAELEAFAYSVSHDLRAPLRAMQGFAQALTEDCAVELGATGLEYVRRIIGGATRLDALIQDLLCYSRLSHSNLDLERVDLHKLISDALTQLEATLQESRASVSVEEPLLPLVGHHPTLLQVIGNLLSNSVKFVGPGVSPRIELWMEAAHGMGRLWIVDNGIGVAPEFHGRIFRVFERLHGVETYPGTGVGLAIVRKGVERMGGKVGVESASGQGSRFWIELPLAQAEANTPLA